MKGIKCKTSQTNHLIKELHQFLRLSLAQGTNSDVGLQGEAELLVSVGVARWGVEEPAAAERIPAFDETGEVGHCEAEAADA